MNQFVKIVMPVVFITAFVCCEKEKPLLLENQESLLLTREIYSDQLTYEYTYNNQNLLKERKSKYFYASYSYDSDNQLTSYDMYEDSRIYSSDWTTAQEAMKRDEWVNPENTEISGRGFYIYSHGKLAKIEVQRFPNDYKNTSEFELDENGRISKQTFYSKDNPSGTIEFTYDDSGNLILKQQFDLVDGTAVLSTSTAYEFDNKKNPFRAFKRLLLPGNYTNQNNIIKETLTLFFEVPGFENNGIQVQESVYEYNEQGYPVLKDNLIRYEYQ